jgi:outer membrane immunogenic protein
MKHNSTIISLTAASFFALAASANASDLLDGVLDQSADQPAGVTVDWSGLYIGVHGGWAQGDWSGTPTVDDANGGIYKNGPFAGENYFSNHSVEGDNWLAGVTVGANKQIGQIVFGIEADGSWGEFGGNSTFATRPVGAGLGGTEWDVEQELDNLGTLRGRLGYSLGSVLLYGTGGVAFAQTSATQSTFDIANDGSRTGNMANATAEENHIGWAAGAGAEWAVTHNWSLKAEWLHVDLGKADYSFDGARTNGTPYRMDNFNSSLEMDIIRAGLNYRF